MDKYKGCTPNDILIQTINTKMETQTDIGQFNIAVL